jgi:isocitrate lyase
MTLMNLFLVHRYKIDSVHYLSPSEDNLYQTAKMKTLGIFSEVNDEVGEIIVADVNAKRVEELLSPGRPGATDADPEAAGAGGPVRRGNAALI